jgi:hypothetical protein
MEPPNESGLHEYVDAEFSIDGLESPVREKALRDVLEQLPSLGSLRILQGKVTAHYEPVLFSQKKLEEAIERAGFQISESHVTASSPLIDALQKNLQEGNVLNASPHPENRNQS